MNDEANPIITLEIDWAPEFMIDFAAEKLIDHRVKATWFVTHACPAVDRLRQYPDLFELGIHPNFLVGSTHGDSVSEVLKHCLEIVPEAVSMRTHALVQSSPLLAKVMQETPIQNDVSLFLPYATNISAVDYYYQGQLLRRYPFYWEDDFEMERAEPRWICNRENLNTGCLKIYKFHPIHFNTKRMEHYEASLQCRRSLDLDYSLPN